MVARPYQLIWLLGAIVFCLAVYSTTQASPPSQWVEKVMPQKPQAPEVVASPPAAEQAFHGRPSLEEHIRLAEKSWAKGVKQRHETLKEWPSTKEMPM